MKNELKISTLSIVCVLCAAFTAPAFGAAAVRSLGGAGTYASASSAAAAKSSGKTGGGSVSSVRGGSVRVSPSVKNTTTGTTSSRAATTPRLSIGKYLGASSVIGGASNKKPGLDAGGNGNNNGNLQDRIEFLESLALYAGFDETDKDQKDIPTQLLEITDRLDGVEFDVDALKSDLSALTAGMVTDVVYDSESGELVVTKSVDGVETIIEYPLSTLNDLLALEQKLNAELAKYALISDVATKAQLTALETTLRALIDANAATGDYAGATEFNALLLRVSELEEASELTAGDIADLQAEIDLLKQATANPVTIAMLNALESRLSASLENALSAYYTKSEIDALLDGAPTQEQMNTFATKEELNGLSGLVDTNKNAIAGLESALEQKAALATVNALSDKLDVVKVTADGASNLANDNAVLIEELKGKTQNLGALAYKDTVSTSEIDNKAVTAAQLNTDSLGSNGMAIVQNTANGAVWRTVQIIDENGNPVE